MAHILVDHETLSHLAKKHLGLTSIELQNGCLIATKKGTGSDSDLVLKICDINSAISVTYGEFQVKASRLTCTTEGLKLEFGLSSST